LAGVEDHKEEVVDHKADLVAEGHRVDLVVADRREVSVEVLHRVAKDVLK
jgi:uncharacterized membrane-anchored protein